MLTEQNVIMELTGSNDTVIGFITTDDGHALLIVDGKTIDLTYILHVINNIDIIIKII